jgi:hypothetical protein
MKNDGMSDEPKRVIGAFVGYCACALVGAFVGYMATTVGFGLTTGSNLSGFIGLILGVPVGAILGILAFSKIRRR